MTRTQDEIRQQPATLRELLAEEIDPIREVVAELRQRDIRYVLMAARGTSDNAARYGKYLFGSQLGLQVALATPSLFTLYDLPPKLEGALVIGVSQSGQSEDIVSVLAEAQRQRAPTLAVTNHPDSPLASHADYIVNLHAGVEQAVAATKTYTAQLTALALLATVWLDVDDHLDQLHALPDKVALALELESDVVAAAGRYVEANHCVVLGRGYNYSTAFEIALKLKETSYLAAEPYSPADFLHGPIALLNPGYPAIIVAPSGVTFDHLTKFSHELREKGASLITISDRDEALEQAQVPLKIPAGVPEWLSPITAIVPGQLLAVHLSIARGIDPDSPRGLRKVTSTR